MLPPQKRSSLPFNSLTKSFSCVMQGSTSAKDTTTPSTSASTPATLPIEPVPLPQGSTQPVFKGGRAQEVINGRAAMLGFVAALGAELASGLSVWQQVTLK